MSKARVGVLAAVVAGVLLHALFEVNQSPATATPFRVATHLLLAAVALVAVRGYVRCARTRTGRSRAGYTFAAATSLLWAVSEVIRTSSESVVPTSSAAVGAALLSLMAVICAIVASGWLSRRSPIPPCGCAARSTD